MKKILAVLWVMVLLVPLACCGAQKTENKDEAETSSSKWEVSEQEEKTEMIAFDKDAEEMQDPLVICMDLEYAGRNRYTDASVIVNDFLMTLEQTGGLADVKGEYLPASGAERESMLSRLRVELMAGKGPDVFIVNGRGALGSGAQESEALFTMPQKHMETGLFLPLDTYMENNSRFTDWSRQNQTVLAAGRNDEGQQIIPLVYTLPVICYKKSEASYAPDATATWDDMLHDPALSVYAKRLADCAAAVEGEDGMQAGMNGSAYISHILGVLADYEQEELNFTEEELLCRVQEIVALYTQTDASIQNGEAQPDHFEGFLGWDLVSDAHAVEDNIAIDEAKTMIPLYCDDGGAVATVMSWAAVNRNTKRPEDAFTVIDMLMRDEMQTNSLLYGELLISFSVGITMNDEVLSPELPMRRVNTWSLTAENYAELCSVREQIVDVNFDCAIDAVLSELLLQSVLLYGPDDPAGVEQAVADAYEQIQRMVRE